MPIFILIFRISRICLHYYSIKSNFSKGLKVNYLKPIYLQSYQFEGISNPMSQQ